MRTKLWFCGGFVWFCLGFLIVLTGIPELKFVLMLK